MQEVGSEYERLVCSLLENFKAAETLKIICSGKDCKVTGSSDIAHQIDVFCENTEDGSLILVECKFHSPNTKRNTVGLRDVLVLHGRITDIQKARKVTVEGVIITTNRYTKGAKKYADFWKIKLGDVQDETQFRILLQNWGYLGQSDSARGVDEVFLVEKRCPTCNVAAVLRDDVHVCPVCDKKFG